MVLAAISRSFTLSMCPCLHPLYSEEEEQMIANSPQQTPVLEWRLNKMEEVLELDRPRAGVALLPTLLGPPHP